MSADMLKVITEALAAHTLHYIVPADPEPTPGSKWHVECDCHWTHLADEHRPGEITHATHQARAVLAAISEAGAVEWGVRWEEFGSFPDWTRPYDSEEQAREGLASSAFPGLIVSRIKFPWERAE